MCFDRCPVTAQTLSGGVFVSTLTPFDQCGHVFCEPITDQARRIARINGVRGIAVNTNTRERLTLSGAERIDVIRSTRKGMMPNQLLLAYVGELTENLEDEAYGCCTAGADVLIVSPAGDNSRTYVESQSVNFAKLTDKLSVPVILTLGNGENRWESSSEEITELASSSRQILGFELGSANDVLQYDQVYYALKSIDRPLAVLSSSDGALFHNLNTGGDGVLSCVSYIAPHEITDLYKATCEGRFYDAQAIHTQLAPLFALLNAHDTHSREMIYRHAAHIRGLLASADVRGITTPLSSQIVSNLNEILDAISLKQISWV